MPLSDQSKSYLSELIRLNKKDLIAIGYQKLTVDGTAGGVSLTVPTNASYALIVLESSVTGQVAIRYLECGNTVYAVTATDGIGRSHLDAFDIDGKENMTNFRAIQTTAGTHTLHVQYYK